MSFQWSRTDGDIGVGFLRIAREQIGKAITEAESVQDSPERRVHETRRRCKKLRALFRLVRTDFGAYKRENAFVRDAAKGLSQSRDTRVARQTFEDLMAWAGRPVTTIPPEAVDPATEEAALREFAGHMRELYARSTTWKVDDIGLGTLTSGLKQTYQRARWTRRFAERHRTDEAFHEWRKYAKYHWNQLGLLEECAVDILPSAHKSAGELAEALGLHHDLAVLGHVLDTSPAEVGDDVDVGATRAAIAGRQAELEARIASLGQQVFAERPKALKSRFDAYLSGWTAREAAE
ncbi:CHAD domain-containing protein [Devosia sp. CN2-171]|uniref:CHAD domain-containing protein n=1 Tax=Devosia sp. CN2-171 TaxID=3400909 RepID=UPI003BF7964E